MWRMNLAGDTLLMGLGLSCCLSVGMSLGILLHPSKMSLTRSAPSLTVERAWRQGWSPSSEKHWTKSTDFEK